MRTSSGDQDGSPLTPRPVLTAHRGSCVPAPGKAQEVGHAALGREVLTIQSLRQTTAQCLHQLGPLPSVPSCLSMSPRLPPSPTPRACTARRLQMAVERMEG